MVQFLGTALYGSNFLVNVVVLVNIRVFNHLIVFGNYVIRIVLTIPKSVIGSALFLSHL